MHILEHESSAASAVR